MLTADGQSSFAELQAAFDEGASHPLTYFVFDLLHLNGHNLRQSRLPSANRSWSRCSIACRNTRSSVRPAYRDRGRADFDQACRLGAEGIVSKRSDSAYSSGRSKSWIKIKCVRRQEFVIGGFTKPANGTEGIGALVLGYYEGKKLIYAGRTGTGFTQVSGRKLRQQLEAMRQSKMPFVEVPRRGGQGRPLDTARIGGRGSVQHLDCG